jgi:phosphoglycerate dehydrogenase-like enzyme
VSGRDRPAVHVGPEATEGLLQAVRDGGGEPAPLEAADAVVWAEGPDTFPDALPDRVRWVQLPSAGVERWFASGRLDDARTWTSAAGAYGAGVAEHALTLLLALLHRVPDAVRARSWGAPEGVRLTGRTVAVVGAGGIGRELIRLMAPHRPEVLAVTRRGLPVDGAARTLPADRVAEVWPLAEAVVLAAPATDATRHLVGAEALAALPDHAVLVNIARGSLVDTDALVAALHEGRLAGAGLDVTDPEPLPDGHPLWDEPNAIITPHVANPPAVDVEDLNVRVRENVARFAAGEELIAPIDLEAGY